MSYSTESSSSNPAIEIQKTTIVRAFNSHFFDFLEDIIRIIPENVEIVSAKLSAEMVRKANPTTILKAWYKYIYQPYWTVIDAGDLSFFFEKDYAEDLRDFNNSNEILKIIQKIRKPICEMNEANQCHTRKYIQNLTKLSGLYFS